MIVPSQSQTLLNFMVNRVFDELEQISQISKLKDAISNTIIRAGMYEFEIKPTPIISGYSIYGRHHTLYETARLSDGSTIGFSQPKLISYLARANSVALKEETNSTLNHIAGELITQDQKSIAHDSWVSIFPHEYVLNWDSLNSNTIPWACNSPFITELPPTDRQMTSSLYIYEILYRVFTSIIKTHNIWSVPGGFKTLRGYYSTGMISTSGTLESDIISDISKIFNYNDRFYTALSDMIIKNITAVDHAGVSYANSIKNILNSRLKQYLWGVFQTYLLNNIDFILVEIGRKYSNLLTSHITDDFFKINAGLYETAMDGSTVSEQASIDLLIGEISDLRADQLLFLDGMVTDNADNHIDMLNNYVHAYSQLSIDIGMFSVDKYRNRMELPVGMKQSRLLNTDISIGLIAQDISTYIDGYNFTTASNSVLLDFAVQSTISKLFMDFMVVEEYSFGFISNIITPVMGALSNTTMVANPGSISTAISLAFNDTIYNDPTSLSSTMLTVSSALDYSAPVSSSIGYISSVLGTEQLAYSNLSSKIPDIMSSSITSILMAAMLDQFAI